MSGHAVRGQLPRGRDESRPHEVWMVLVVVALTGSVQAVTAAERVVALPDGGTLHLTLVPAGRFVMGAPEDESSLDGDESPQFEVEVGALWVGAYEVTNAQFALFAPGHDSRFMDTSWKDRVGPGLPLNGPNQPVVRVSWNQAVAFCEWLAEVTGEQFRLPTEAEWEYACRAGTEGPFHCAAEDLAAYANLADQSLAAVKPWALREGSLNDGHAVTADVGRFRPNAWGLFDMHGNVQEWCASAYEAYPLTTLEPIGPEAPGLRVVRGGSFDDRPRRARSAFRLAYPPTQGVYNVGFRVVLPAAGGPP